MRQFLAKCLENTSILNDIKPSINFQLDFMIQWGKSIPCAQQLGDSHQTTSKALHDYIRPWKYPVCLCQLI